MKKLRMILPMLAFVLAIGMSFAYVNAEKSMFPAYVYDSGVWTAVDVNCPGTGRNCTVQFVDEFGNPLSNVLDVYPIPSFKDKNGEDVEPLKTSNPFPELIVIE